MIRYYPNKHIVIKKQGDGWGLLINQQTHSSYAINELGVDIWGILEKHPTIKQVIEHVNNLYSCHNEKSLAEDIESFIHQLASENLIVKHDTQDVMPFPVSVYIALTNQCNLTCSYCNYFSYSRDTYKYNDRPVNDWLDFIRNFHELGGRNVCLSGGEPFMYKDIRDIFDLLNKKELTFCVLSNGTNIPAEAINDLCVKNCCYVQLSLDGANAFEHERYRGKGTFKTIINNCNRLINAGVNVSVRVTLNDYNSNAIEEIADYYFNEIGVNTIQYSWCLPIGRGQRMRNEYILAIDTRSDVLKKISVLANTYKGKIVGASGPLADLLQWRMMIDFTSERIDNLPYKGGFLSGCGCTKHMISARSDGRLVPCILLQDMILGDISDDLLNIWQQSNILLDLRNRENISMYRFEECASCQYVNSCTGDCPAIPHVYQDNIDVPNYTNCLKTYLKDGGIVPQA